MYMEILGAGGKVYYGVSIRCGLHATSLLCYRSYSLPACFRRDTPTRSVLQYFSGRVNDKGWMADSTQQ